MEWSAFLDWEEGLFRSLLSFGKTLRKLRPESDPAQTAAEFDAEAESLSVVARILAGEPVRLQRARGLGGVRGADIILPDTLDFAPNQAENRDAYVVQVVVAAGIRRLTRDRLPAPDDSFENAVESLRLAREAVDLMSSELPVFRERHDRALQHVLASRQSIDIDRLPPREADLERLRRSAMVAMNNDWERDPSVATLVGRRKGRRRSPEIPIWGTWFPTAGEASVGEPTGDLSAQEEPTTEIDAPAIDAIRRVELDKEACEDPAPSVAFERAESLDSYRGGARDLDGSDELEAHLDALEQVELGDLFRGSESSLSLLKAHLELGLEVSDASGGPAEEACIRYDEWDVRGSRYRKDWCSVYPAKAEYGDPLWAKTKLHEHRDLIETLKRRLEKHRAGLRAAPRQLDGEEIDIEAVVDDLVTRRAGRSADPRIYRRLHKRRRDFATTILLDVSMSTDSWVDGRRVLDVAKEAALVLCEVADQLGDRIQVLGFASETRNRCHVWEALGFGEDWQSGMARLSWLQPQGYTRIGPALRHATAELAKQPAERRLLLLISDGKPTDYDRYEGRYGIADVRRAIGEADRSEIQAHALAIDSVARDYLPPLFGEGGWHVLPRPEDLVEVLTEVYGRLTSR